VRREKKGGWVECVVVNLYTVTLCVFSTSSSLLGKSSVRVIAGYMVVCHVSLCYPLKCEKVITVFP
jgi:hypothetical protein